MMDDLMRDPACVLVAVDDILIFLRNIEEHHRHVAEVLQCLRVHNLFEVPHMCAFFGTTTEYLGHPVSPSGIAALPSKVVAVERWPFPTSPKELRHFLGSAGCYRHFTRNFASIATPLMETHILKHRWDGARGCLSRSGILKRLKPARISLHASAHDRFESSNMVGKGR
jgi:hypothetical protein